METPHRSYRSSRYEHPTETDPRVFSYLEACFGSTPVLNEEGADLVLPNGVTVEVKATKEWHKSTHSRGSRRRGRFCFHGYEECDFFLFVLVQENGQLQLHLENYLTAIQKFGISGTINWAKVFPTIN